MAGPPPEIGVVEDDPAVRQALRRLLRIAGYRVVLFVSAEEFLGAGASEMCDCLILDVRLPGQSGLHLQSCLVGAGHYVPVIFISAPDDEATGAQAMAGGATDFLRKPFMEQALLDAVATALAPRPVKTAGVGADTTGINPHPPLSPPR